MKKKYKDDEYRTIFGVTKITFEQMVKLVEIELDKIRKKGGRKDGATPQEWVEITLKYLRQYMSQRYLAHEYGIAKSCISPIVIKTSKILVESGAFRLPNKVDNIYDTSEDRVIDATESRIDRPQVNQEDWYSGKQGEHTIKTQIEIGFKSLLIYSIEFAKGSVHDFKLFKNTDYDFSKDIKLLFDLGYVGVLKIHKNSIIPIKSSKTHKLDSDEKWFNREVSKIRIVIEHTNAFIKKFKMVSTRFRNRRQNFKLFMSLICGIYNFETANI